MAQSERMQIILELVDKVSGKINKVMNNVKKDSGSLGQQFKRNEVRFQGWAMSIMFFGMAIQRVFLNIWKQSTQVFNDVMHSVEGTVTGFDMLQGSMKYLWYTIGEALEPLAAQLIPIIMRIQEWVSTHEELTRKWVKWGIIIGTIMMLVGTLVLGFNGVFTAVRNLITIMKALRIAFLWLSANPFVIMIAGIVAAITWIIVLMKNMGGMGEFFKSVLRGVFRAVLFLMEGIAWLFGKIGEGVVWIINKMIQGLNWVIEKVNKIPGINIGTIGQIEISTSKFGDTFLGDYADWEKNSFLAPKQGYAQTVGDALLGKGSESQNIVLQLDTATTDAFLKGEEVNLGYGSMN